MLHADLSFCVCSILGKPEEVSINKGPSKGCL